MVVTEEIAGPTAKRCTGTSDKENLVWVFFKDKMNRIIFINSITTEIFTVQLHPFFFCSNIILRAFWHRRASSFENPDPVSGQEQT